MKCGENFSQVQSNAVNGWKQFRMKSIYKLRQKEKYDGSINCRLLNQDFLTACALLHTRSNLVSTIARSDLLLSFAISNILIHFHIKIRKWQNIYNLYH